MKFGGGDFPTFKACYEKKLKDQMKGYSSDKWNNLRAFADNGGFNFLSKMEESYNCASLCSVPLFYMTKGLENGRPTRDCLTAVAEDLGETPAGYVTLLAGLLILVSLIGACPLCGGS